MDESCSAAAVDKSLQEVREGPEFCFIHSVRTCKGWFMKALGGLFCTHYFYGPNHLPFLRSSCFTLLEKHHQWPGCFPSQLMKIYAPTWVLVRRYRDMVCLHLDGLLKAVVLPCCKMSLIHLNTNWRGKSHLIFSLLNLIFQDVLAQTTGKNTPSLVCCMPGAMNWASRAKLSFSISSQDLNNSNANLPRIAGRGFSVRSLSVIPQGQPSNCIIKFRLFLGSFPKETRLIWLQGMHSHVCAMWGSFLCLCPPQWVLGFLFLWQLQLSLMEHQKVSKKTTSWQSGESSGQDGGET